MSFTSWTKLQFLRMYTTHFWKWGRFVWGLSHFWSMGWLIRLNGGTTQLLYECELGWTRAAHWNEMVDSMAIPVNPARVMKNNPSYSQWIEVLKKSPDFPWCWHVFTSKISCVPMALKKTQVWNFAAQGLRARWCHDHLQASDWSPSEWPACHRYWLPEGTWCFFWILKDWNCYMKTTLIKYRYFFWILKRGTKLWEEVVKIIKNLPFWNGPCWHHFHPVPQYFLLIKPWWKSSFMEMMKIKCLPLEMMNIKFYMDLINFWKVQVSILFIIHGMYIYIYRAIWFDQTLSRFMESSSSSIWGSVDSNGIPLDLDLSENKVYSQWNSHFS